MKIPSQISDAQMDYTINILKPYQNTTQIQPLLKTLLFIQCTLSTFLLFF